MKYYLQPEVVELFKKFTLKYYRNINSDWWYIEFIESNSISKCIEKLLQQQREICAKESCLIINSGSPPKVDKNTILFAPSAIPKEDCHCEKLRNALDLAQAEIRAMYKRVGINGSNVLDLIDNLLKTKQ